MRTSIKMILLVAFSGVAAFAADAKAGQALYDKACKSCHGADGTPNAAVAKMMKVDVPDLKSPAVQALSEDDMKKVITDGKGKMKPVKTVTGKDIGDVVAFVHTLKK